jgi:hypothetical protein
VLGERGGSGLFGRINPKGIQHKIKKSCSLPYAESSFKGNDGKSKTARLLALLFLGGCLLNASMGNALSAEIIA